MISTNDFAGILKAVEVLGGTVPPKVQATVDTAEAFSHTASPGINLTSHLLKQAVKGAVDSGQAMTYEDVWKAGKNAAVTQLVRKELGDHLGEVDYYCALMIQAMLRGAEGTTMFSSLQGVVDEAIAGIEAAAAHYGPDSTLTEVVEAGNEALAAWRSTQAHERKLDQLLTTVLRPTMFVELLPPSLFTDLGRNWLAAWFLPIDRAVTDAQGGHLTRFDAMVVVGLELDRSGVAWKVPGGRWLHVHRMCGLQLNNPQQAIEVLQQVQGAHTEALQGHTPRQAAPMDIGFEETVEVDKTAVSHG